MLRLLRRNPQRLLLYLMFVLVNVPSIPSKHADSELAAASLCGFVDVTIWELHINPYNVVGLVCSIVGLINTVQLLVLFREPSEEAMEVIRRHQPVDIIQERHPMRIWVGAWGWVLLWVICNFVWTVFEVHQYRHEHVALYCPLTANRLSTRSSWLRNSGGKKRKLGSCGPERALYRWSSSLATRRFQWTPPTRSCCTGFGLS